MATEPAIDPRYAAQFQRGYDPARHAPAPDRRGPLRIDSGPPEVRRVPGPPPVRERPAVAAASVVVDASPAAETLPVARPRLEWALLAVGLGLLVLSGLLFWQSVESSLMYQGTGPSFEEQLAALAAATLPGPLLVGGVMAVILWIALRSVRLPEQS